MGESAVTSGHQPLGVGQTLVVAVSPQRELVLCQYDGAGLDADPVVGKHSPAIQAKSLDSLSKSGQDSSKSSKHVAILQREWSSNALCH